MTSPSPPHSRDQSPTRLHLAYPDQDDFTGPRERDGSPKRQYNGPRGESPEGVHPGENVFNFPEGGPVRLTGLTPISPTNEEVFGPGVNSYQNPQPAISVLSPRQSVGYPFLFSAGHPPIFSIAENEKYRKLMAKKQRRDNKKEKNVKMVMKAEDVAGYVGTDDTDAILMSLGESTGDVKKGKKKVEKAEKPKGEKKGRRSMEKNMEDDETTPLLKDEEEEDLAIVNGEAEEKVKIVKEEKRSRFQDPVVDDLRTFGENFYLVNPEEGGLKKGKSTENLGKSNESLNFTKVTSKKHRGKKGKEENGGKPPPDKLAGNTRTSAYALRSRDVMPGTHQQNNRSTESGVSSPTSSVGSTSHIQPIDPPPPTNIYNQRHPIVAPIVALKDNKMLNNEVKSAKNKLDFSADFPALPGLGSKADSRPEKVVVGAWSRPITVKAKENNQLNNILVNGNKDKIETIESDVGQQLREKEDNDEKIADMNNKVAKSDIPAVIQSNLGVPLEPCQNYNEDNSSDSKTCCDSELNSSDEIIEISKDSSVEIPLISKNNNYVNDISYDDITNGEESIIRENCDETEDSVEVVLTEEEFDRATVNPANNPPVLILGDNEEDWKSTAEFSFGFDVNEELVARSLRGDLTPVPDSYQTPLTPINTMDDAILSFGVGGGGPVIVGVPVPYPYPAGFVPPAVSLPAPFPHYIASSYAVPLPNPTVPQFSHQDIGISDNKNNDEIHTVSPESGISSASPLSWQPDSSPSLHAAPSSPGHAPGSYPRHAPGSNQSSGSILHHVNESLENWSGPDSSDCSSRASPVPDDPTIPAPSWASQVDMSLGEPGDDEDNDDIVVEVEKDIVVPDADVNANRKATNASDKKWGNYDQIVKYISDSWSSVSKEVASQPQAVHYYDKSVTALKV